MPRLFSEAETMAEVQMKVLVVFLLPVLGCSLTRMSTCDMMTHLKHWIDDLSVEETHGLGGEHFRAKLVCYANLANGLNTSAVRNLDDNNPNVTFYGTFQHRNDLLCSDGTIASRNLCGQDCRNFVDGDIKDDAMCLFTILLHFLEHGFKAEPEIQQHIQLIFDPSCANALDNGYSCSNIH